MNYAMKRNKQRWKNIGIYWTNGKKEWGQNDDQNEKDKAELIIDRIYWTSKWDSRGNRNLLGASYITKKQHNSLTTATKRIWRFHI